VVGTIIGSAIFVQPSEVTAHVPNVAGVIAVWLAAGLLSLLGALVCAELASTFTRTGGVYVYLTEAFGPGLGFLWGWAMFWVMHSGIIAAIAVIFARYAGHVAPLDDAGTRLVAIGVILLLSAVNYLGTRPGVRLQTAFTVGKLVAVGLIVGAGIVLGGRVPAHCVGSAGAAGPPGASSLLAGLGAGLFAFGGWHIVTYSSEETVDPRRTIPRALMAGMLIVTVSYVAMNAVYLYVLPLDTVASSTRVAADLADALVGTGGGSLIAFLVMFSSFGALAGIVLAGPRVYLAMARDGLLFRWAGAIHPVFRTPSRAILLQAVWASVLVATGTFRTLVGMVIYTEWLFFGLMTIGLFRIRRRADVRRDYTMPGFPVLPVLFVAAAFSVGINEVVARPAQSLGGLLLVLAGLPVYLLWARRAAGRKAAA